MNTPSPPSGTGFLTVEQAAELAGVTPRTIRSWLTKGHLIRHRAADGYHVRVHPVELAEWLRVRRAWHPGPLVDESPGECGL